MAETVKLTVTKEWQKLADNPCVIYSPNYAEFEFYAGDNTPDENSPYMPETVETASKKLAINLQGAIYIRLSRTYGKENGIDIVVSR